MADYAALQEQNKLSALRAMAAGNPDPYAGSSDVISGAQDEALTRYASDAAGRASPQGAVDQGKAMISGPGDNALAGLGMSSDAYQKQLAAMHNEAANAAAPPGTGGSSGSTKQGPGYNQYGGYATSAEYENAVLGRAVQAETDRAAEVATQRAAFDSANTESNIGAVQALQAKNEAVVGGPGAVIHGVGWKDNPTPWTPAGGVAPAQMPQEYVGKPGFGYNAPAGNPGTPSASEHSNYTPEAVAMLRAASDQANERQRLAVRDTAATFDPMQTAIADPRNMYEFAQRAAINELGGDPYEAIGRFSPDWAMKTYAIPEVKGPNDYQAVQNEALERAANPGGYTDADMRGRRTTDMRNTQDYDAGAAIAEQQIASMKGGPKTAFPVTVDGLRAAMAARGVDPLIQAQVVRDYGAAFPGASFFTQPEEQATAAANAGNLNG